MYNLIYWCNLIQMTLRCVNGDIYLIIAIDSIDYLKPYIQIRKLPYNNYIKTQWLFCRKWKIQKKN